MNIKKSAVSVVLAAAAVSAFGAVPEVTSVTMSQASDSRLVTITYTLSDAPAVITLDVQTNANTSAAADDPGWSSIGGRAMWNAEGDVWKKIETGSRTITWRPDLSWPDHRIADGCARAVVTAWATNNTPDYMSVDITATGGEGTQTYYPAADFVPGGVTNNAIYKTSTILMRKIMAKNVTWMMGSVAETGRTAARETPHQVTLSNNYYIGVFPVTQTQWQQITGYNPSEFSTERAMRPVDKVTYTDIRQGVGTASTAASATGGVYPDPPYGNSFLGLLRNKTKLDFDLPSEAQWEFAARAGNGEGYWGDGSAMNISDGKDERLDVLGRYTYNGGMIGPDSTTRPPTDCAVTNGTPIVGSYLPNVWGLYDVHGGVWEWCLDWYADNITALNGAVNTTSSDNRVRRGGTWGYAAGNCRPAYRNKGDPATRDRYNGFRVVCTAGLQ